MLLRQLLYFGVPLGLLTMGALQAWGADRTPYTQYMLQAQSSSQPGAATRPPRRVDGRFRA